jgi:hypothetical protein
MGDHQTFDNVILNPIRDDLLKNTWLHERFACDGTQQLNRTEYYFEYPALVSILLRQIRYGINMELRNVSISPFQSTLKPFSYHIGNVHVDYNAPTSVQINLPGSGTRNFFIAGLTPSTWFDISSSESCEVIPPKAASDPYGRLSFKASIGEHCPIIVKQQQPQY